MVEKNKKKGVALYMIIITSNSGHEAYGLKSFVIDTKEDLDNTLIRLGYEID